MPTVEDIIVARYQMTLEDFIARGVQIVPAYYSRIINAINAEDVEALQEMAGGEEQYGQLLEWASDNFSEEEIDLYDAVMDQGDPAACFFAVQTLMGRYADAQGYDGELLTGKGAPSQSSGFRSQAELIAAMGDPRYDTDPAYRQDVINTLENSDIDF